MTVGDWGRPYTELRPLLHIFWAKISWKILNLAFMTEQWWDQLTHHFCYTSIKTTQTFCTTKIFSWQLSEELRGYFSSWWGEWITSNRHKEASASKKKLLVKQLMDNFPLTVVGHMRDEIWKIRKDCFAHSSSREICFKKHQVHFRCCVVTAILSDNVSMFISLCCQSIVKSYL